MTFVMVTGRFPLNKAVEIGKLFTARKLPEVADFVKRINIFIIADEEVKTYTLYEMPNDKLHDCIVWIGQRYAGFREIENFKYKIETLMTMKDALPMIGLV